MQLHILHVTLCILCYRPIKCRMFAWQLTILWWCAKLPNTVKHTVYGISFTNSDACIPFMVSNDIMIGKLLYSIRFRKHYCYELDHDEQQYTGMEKCNIVNLRLSDWKSVHLEELFFSIKTVWIYIYFCMKPIA